MYQMAKTKITLRTRMKSQLLLLLAALHSAQAVLVSSLSHHL